MTGIDSYIMEVVLIAFGAGIFAGMIVFLASLAIVSVLNIARKFY